MKPTYQFDSIIVGAGPAGSTTALALSRAGLRVALIERGEYAGAKNVSGAALYAPELMAELLPNYWEEAPVERYLTRRVVTFLEQESAFALDFRTRHFAQPPYNGFTLLRPKFDRWLGRQRRQERCLSPLRSLITCSTRVSRLLECAVGARMESFIPRL